MSPAEQLQALKWSNESVVICTDQADPPLKRSVVAWVAELTAEFKPVWEANKTLFQSMRVFAIRMVGGRFWLASIDNPARMGQTAKNLLVSRASTSDIKVPSPPGMEYRPFQLAGIEYARSHRNTLFADEMGLGKTIQGIGVMNDDPSIQTILAICPAYLKLNWRAELRRWMVVDRPIVILDSDTCERLPATSPPIPALPDGASAKEKAEHKKKKAARSLSRKLVFPADRHPRVVIVNYEILHRFDRIPHFDLMICDEAHYIKSLEALRTQAVFTIKTRRTLAMTGTPALNRPVELYALIKLMMGSDAPPYRKFVVKFCGAKQNGTDVSGCTNPILLQQFLRKSFMVRRLKKDVLKELPPKERQIIELPATGKIKMAVDMERGVWQLHEDTLAELRARRDEAEIAGDDVAFAEIGRSYSKQMQIAFTALSKLRVELSLFKVPLIANHLQDAMAGNDNKFVVFFYHKDALYKLAEELKEFRPLVITGDVSMPDRNRNVEAFQNDPSRRLILGTIGAMGTGVTLTASSNVICAELDWRPGIMAQAEDRTHRIGQLENVLCQYFLFEDSVDSKMIGDLIAKMENLSKILDGEGDVENEAKVKRTREKKPVYNWEADIKSITPGIRERVLKALVLMTSKDADMARIRNGEGFSRFDAGIGHRLASKEELTTREAAFAKHLLFKYRRQLPNDMAQALWPTL